MSFPSRVIPFTRLPLAMTPNPQPRTVPFFTVESRPRCPTASLAVGPVSLGLHDTVWPFRFNFAPPISFSTPTRSG